MSFPFIYFPIIGQDDWRTAERGIKFKSPFLKTHLTRLVLLVLAGNSSDDFKMLLVYGQTFSTLFEFRTVAKREERKCYFVYLVARVTIGLLESSHLQAGSVQSEVAGELVLKCHQRTCIMTQNYCQTMEPHTTMTST